MVDFLGEENVTERKKQNKADDNGKIKQKYLNEDRWKMERPTKDMSSMKIGEGGSKYELSFWRRIIIVKAE